MMKGRDSSRRRERDGAAERILKAAIALFTERGYHGTPMRSIADSVEKIADATSPTDGVEAAAAPPPTEQPGPAKEKEHSHV